MELLGCLLIVIVFGCIASFFAVGLTMLILGTIALMFKMIIWMAWVGGFIVLFILLGLVFAKLFR